MNKVFCLLAFAGFTAPILGQAPLATTPWNYTQGGADWADLGYDKCVKPRQSPIPLCTGVNGPCEMGNQPTAHGDLPGPMLLQGYCDDITGTFINDGHNLMFEPTPGQNVSIEKGVLPNFRYNFTRLTVFWGENSTVGSNHVVDDQRYEAEITILHQNEYYEGVEETALGKYHGFMAISLLVQTKAHAYNEGFEPILEAAETLAASGANTTAEVTINLRKLMNGVGGYDTEVFDFVQYRGSQPHPICSQSYGWIIPTKPITVSTCQLNALRKLKTEADECMLNTWRALTPIGEAQPHNYITAHEQEVADIKMP